MYAPKNLNPVQYKYLRKAAGFSNVTVKGDTLKAVRPGLAVGLTLDDYNTRYIIKDHSADKKPIVKDTMVDGLRTATEHW